MTIYWQSKKFQCGNKGIGERVNKEKGKPFREDVCHNEPEKRGGLHKRSLREKALRLGDLCLKLNSVTFNVSSSTLLGTSTDIKLATISLSSISALTEKCATLGYNYMVVHCHTII